MNNKEIDLKTLDKIFDDMIDAMNQSKNDIYTIGEQSRSYFEQLKFELEEIKDEIALLIAKTDLLEVRSRQARVNLAKVSKDFALHSEEEVRRAYEDASELQLELSIHKMTEKQLRERRDDLERRLESLYETIEKSDQLINRVGVVINYLTSDLKVVGEVIEKAKEKQDFSIKFIETLEDYRKKLSRDIHDGPAQMLANILLRTSLIEKVYKEQGVHDVLKEWDNLKNSIRLTLVEVRRVIYELRPMDLDDLGIVPALKKYLETINDYEKHITVSFMTRGNKIRLDSNFEVAVFRLVQEAVTNAIKHANPTEIVVNVEWLTDKINLIIKDDGIGFNEVDIKEKSFGLMGMKERLEILQGSMQINSEINKGTKIILQIPFEIEK